MSATEPTFGNEFWDHEEAAVYSDVVSGELLSEHHEVCDGCGWPNFTAHLALENVAEVKERSCSPSRTEVRSIHGDSHVGHVATDGPVGEGGWRFCINAAALQFIAYEELEAEGYEEFKRLFEDSATQGKHYD